MNDMVEHADDQGQAVLGEKRDLQDGAERQGFLAAHEDDAFPAAFADACKTRYQQTDED